MLKIQHTEWPADRKPAPSNEVKEGGLWYRDEQEQLLNQAKRLIKREATIREAKHKQVDQVKIFAKWFWIIFSIASIITIYILNRR